VGVGQAVLLGVEHHETLTRRDAVHARGLRETFRVLAAAVQHHYQGQTLA
jgi:hypothetical protein